MAAVLVALFLLGYILIALEHPLRLNKSVLALLTGVACWGVVLLWSPERRAPLLKALSEHMAGIAGIVFFLLCAMAIVELIQAHQGFALLGKLLPSRRLPALVVGFALMGFLLSAVIDNLTTTLVMLGLLRSRVPAAELRRVLAGLLIIAANAGGAWSPIGDVTTTMLWLGGHVQTEALVRTLLLPALLTVLLPGALVALSLRRVPLEAVPNAPPPAPHARTILLAGIGGLLSVPIFHMLTGLPPVFGAFLAVGLLWLLTELLHGRSSEREHLHFRVALSQIDLSSLLFFVGILLAVDALESAGMLSALAQWLDRELPSKEALMGIMGLLSAIVDNVPLTAACMKMYATLPPNHELWMLLAYAVGTGGSLLVIGSAAGVVAMNAEGLEFFWYASRIGPMALLGYGAGFGALLLMQWLGM